MEIGFVLTFILLLLFALLAIYDAFYLHLVKYRLYEHQDSRIEHLTHTVRSILFPIFLYFFFLSKSNNTFYIGLIVILLDMITLGIDAYSEADSRNFMGGLPRWEYILHLFVNGFHFAAIFVFLVLKIRPDSSGFRLINDFDNVTFYPTFILLIKILLPGTILMALLHILLNFQTPKKVWSSILEKLPINRKIGKTV